MSPSDKIEASVRRLELIVTTLKEITFIQTSQREDLIRLVNNLKREHATTIRIRNRATGLKLIEARRYIKELERALKIPT